MKSKVFLLVWLWAVSLQSLAGDDGVENAVAVEAEERTLAAYEACHEKIEPKLTLYYPAVMAIDDTSGEVTVKFVITKEGRAEQVRILKSSGGRNEQAFRRSTIRTMAQREYEPLDRPCEHIETLEFYLGG